MQQNNASRGGVMRGSFRRIGRELLDVLTETAKEVISPTQEPPPSVQGSHHSPFQYTPLPSASSFRILHLVLPLSGATGRNVPLRGSLIQATTDSFPEYYALSYVWGDSTPCETIEIDGRPLGITANCAAALRRMLQGKARRYIWVDSICINQAETPEALEERGKQVAMMDQIYRNAIQVNVHLGDGDPASDVACKVARSLFLYYTGAITPGPQREFFRRRYETLADDVLAFTPENPYGKLHGLFRLPWFRRIWVVQEVVVGHNVIFYCGGYLLHLKGLVAASDFGRLPYSKLHLDASYGHWKSYLAYHDNVNAVLHRKEAGEPVSNSGLTLTWLLIIPGMMLEATKQEDKIYGLYGVCRRLGFELPAPDYRKPLATIYTEAARAMLHYGPGLDMLSHVCESTGWDWGLPSWVPNFSGCIRRWSPSNPPHLTMFTDGDPAVSGHTQPQYEFVQDGKALRIKGRRLDMLSATGLPWMTDASANLLGDSRLPTGQCISSLTDCIGSWFDVVQGRDDCRDARVAATLLVRLLTRDAAKSQPLSAAHVESSVHYLTWLATRSASHSHLPQPASTGPRGSAPSVQNGADYLLDPGMRAFLGSIMTSTWRTAYRTLSGYLGLGTHTIRNGDIVAVFQGSSSAAIIRPLGDCFQYVGPTYVDGLTDGGFWHQTSPADDEWFVLV